RAMTTNAYRVHGMMQSYFTRKMTGYLDYKGIPWRFRGFPGVSPEAGAAGFSGGGPRGPTAAGGVLWGSAATGHPPLPPLHPPPPPPTPVRGSRGCWRGGAAKGGPPGPPVGSRGLSRETAGAGGFDRARTIWVRRPGACAQGSAGVGPHGTSSSPPLGVTAET